MNELDYYDSPEELFDNGDSRKTLLDGYIKVLLEDDTLNDVAKNRLQQIIDSEQLQDELIDEIKTELNNSNTLNNFITDYTVSELGDMDSPWNTVMDITNDYILSYISNDSHSLYEEFRAYENLWD